MSPISIAAELALEIAEFPLASRPNARHWHVRKPGTTGTVEITHEDEIWAVEVRSNRAGTWTSEAAEIFRERLSL